MERIAEAVLTDGRKLPYVIVDHPPRGGMKYTYFAPDRTYVVQFFNDPEITKDSDFRARLKAIIGKYNPTVAEEQGGAKGNSFQMAEYFSSRFCWPFGIVEKPEFGIVCPAYPSQFFFDQNASTVIKLAGKDKKSNWFTTKNRNYLKREERGDFRSMLSMAILLTRSIRRMHQAGLAHSDLSHNNVLIDPKSGTCVVIDIDSLVVPDLFPPEVIGTRGYIAPEILKTLSYPYHHPERKQASTQTDLHSLAVLLYEYFFFRHPLIGPKIYSKQSAEEDDYLAMGEKATFIEHPEDTSNRPKGLKFGIQDLGPVLEKLFLRAFVDGLHHPKARPSALEWERGLVESWDLLHRCQNPNCEYGWFLFYHTNHPVCPFCGTRLRNEEIVRFHLKTRVRGKEGHWLPYKECNIQDQTVLFPWHIFSGIFPDEKADRTKSAYVSHQNGRWFVVNQGEKGMCSPQGVLIPSGQYFEIKNGDFFQTAIGEKGLLSEVQMWRV